MCIRPINCNLNEFGRPTLTPHGETKIPCGSCFECKNLRSHDWATRVQHELGDHHDNCALTLTYDDENLPRNPEEKKYHFQKFMKRLRRDNPKILHMTSHEYGSHTQRLHHHAIIFGLSFYDKEYQKSTPKGTKLYTSKTLDKIWNLGHANIGEANAQCGYYIASYNTKNHVHEGVNELGEICEYKDSMDASKRPAIGLNYLKRNFNQLVHSGERLPRYYINKMKKYGSMTIEEFVKYKDKHGEKEAQLLIDMFDALTVYEGRATSYERDLNCDLAKYDIHRQKISQDSTYRQNNFTMKDNMEYNLYKEEINEFMGVNHVTKSNSMQSIR